MHSSSKAPSADNERYRLLIDSITDYAIFMLDPAGVVSTWNAGAERIKGYRSDEIIGQHFSRFYPEEDRAAGMPEKALATAARKGRFEYEGWRVKKGGDRFWAHVIIDPIRNDAGNLTGFAKVTRDLSERRAAAEALERSERQFRLLVQGVTDYAIFMLDPDGRVSSWNAGAQRIKGYRPDEIIGKHFSAFYTEEDLAAGLPFEGLETARREGRWEKEGWRVRKDGGRFWAHVVIDAIRDDPGEVIGFAKVTRDVTERREAQAALEEAREALFQSQKLEAIGKLTGGVAHDFNNLLMAVLGSLELLKKRLPDPALLPLVETAIEGAERGATLTQRMLAFARRQEMKIGPVDLKPQIEGMLQFLRRSLGPGVTVELDLAEGSPLVRCDSAQLESALLNLCVNARDAMPDGGPIRISAAETAEAPRSLSRGRYLKLSIADRGVGMTEEILARATEPFYTTKGVGKGTGLGLSMVHGMAVQWGGDLKIRSRPGEGTTVDLWLPVAENQVLEAGQRTADAPAPEIWGPLRVLVVDDDPLVLANTVALLADLGHEAVAAACAEEALVRVKDGESFDALVTDQVMPGMTGLELREAARQARPDLPVLIATGFAEMPAPADLDIPRIAKPFTQADLARALARLAGSPLAQTHRPAGGGKVSGGGRRRASGRSPRGARSSGQAPASAPQGSGA